MLCFCRKWFVGEFFLMLLVGEMWLVVIELLNRFIMCVLCMLLMLLVCMVMLLK